MANEAIVSSSLTIRKGSLDYRSQPSQFTATVSGTIGPTPGAITVNASGGVSVDLSQLTTPSLCRIQNLDTSNVIDVGVWDPETTKFYPLLELLPGESFALRLSRNLGEESGGSGTGTSGATTNRLRLRSNIGSCVALVEAFEA